MHVILFLITIIVSFIIVRIGALAFEITGLEWNVAKFQALSCFTGTGFTTKESELITRNFQRRRIATVLMVLGHAGFVTLVATFANSLRPAVDIKIPFVNMMFHEKLIPWVNLIIIVICCFIIYKLMTRTQAARKLTLKIRDRMIKKEMIKPVPFEEVSVSTAGYGISRVDINETMCVCGKSLRETSLRENDIIVLAIEKPDEIIPNPQADLKIMKEDKIVCFGSMDKIKRFFLRI